MQLLLDQQRFDRVAAEAARTGRSVSAVIRHAIDVCYPGDADVRAAAGRRLLAIPPPEGPDAGWNATKRELAAELEDKLP